MQRLRIAMLAHSVNPRGGVVYAMQLAEAAIDTFPKDRLPTIAQRLSEEFSWAQSANNHLGIYRSLINA